MLWFFHNTSVIKFSPYTNISSIAVIAIRFDNQARESKRSFYIGKKRTKRINEDVSSEILDLGRIGYGRLQDVYVYKERERMRCV